MRRPTRTIRFGTPLLLALALVASACGDDAAESTDTTAAAADEPAATAGFPATVEADNGPVTFEQAPSAIVSLSPSATEMLFAIGAGDQVIAADSFSTFPAAVPVTDLSAFEPNVEAIAGYEPDLVVVSDATAVDALTAIDIPVLQLGAPTTIDGSFAQIELLGAATGRGADAAALVADLQQRIDAVVAGLEPRAEPLTYYHELDDTFYSATSTTFIGAIYGLLGLENIADPADDGSAFGYPQLSVEYIVDADPDLIFLADTKCCGQNAETVAARPGWDALTAVANGSIVELDDDIASRWGPRIVDLLETVAAAVDALPAG